MEIKKPIYIFDLDGTLALIEHRRHFVEGEKKDWPAFFAACIDDKPNWPVIAIFRALRKSGAEIWIWSGRSDEVKKETIEWLRKYELMSNAPACFYSPESFKMREKGDHRPDTSLKYGWLAELEPPERGRIAAVFDDRDRLVEMWRNAGIPCLQVAKGDF